LSDLNKTDRINIRVSKGGHHIPDEDVIRLANRGAKKLRKKIIDWVYQMSIPWKVK